jgi:hypothetical protein
MTEQIGEFLLPETKLSKLSKVIEAAPQIPRLAKPLLKALPEAATAAGITGLQTGGDLNSMELAAILAGGTQIALPLAGAVGAKILGGTTGVGTQAVKKAAEGTPDFVNAMRGNVSESDVLGHVRDALQAVKADRRAAYQQQLAQLPTNIQMDLDPIRQELTDALRDHNIQVVTAPNGAPALDFSRSTMALNPEARNQVSTIYNHIAGWGSKTGDLSPLGVDTLKQAIAETSQSPTSAGEASRASAFTQRMVNAANDALTNQVPGYQAMTRDYARASEFLRNVTQDLSLASKNDGTAIRKFNTLMNQNQQYRQDLVNALSQKAGRDLVAELSGRAMRGWMPSKLGQILDPAAITGFFVHPSMWPEAAGTLYATSPRAVGETARLAGKVTPYIPQAVGALPSQVDLNKWSDQAYQNVINRLNQFYQPPGSGQGYARGGTVDPLRRQPDRAAILRSLIK